MVAASILSPNVGNYYIGKGICSIKLLGETDYVDCGNVPAFEFLAKVTQLDHFSSRTGVKIKDFSAVTELAGTLTMQMEEITARNLAFALMGTLTEPGGSPVDENIHIEIFTDAVIQGAVRFVGTNDIGMRVTVNFPLVQFTPAKAMAFIGASWGTVDLSGDVLADQATGSFGTLTASVAESP